MALYGIVQGGLVNALDSQQIINLLTGVMVDQQVTLAHSSAPPLRLNKTGAAAIQGMMALQRGGTTKAHIGLDASDLFAVINAAGTTVNFGVDDSGNGVFLADLNVQGNDIFFGATNKLDLQASALAGAQTLTIPVIRQAETMAIKPQQNQTAPANPTGTSSTTAVMMGLSSGTTFITPSVTGRLIIFLCGTVFNATAIGDGASIGIRYGTGNGPANGAALTGTAVSTNFPKYVAATTAAKAPFGIFGFATGLTLGTAYYIDATLAAITAGTATIQDLTLCAVEF